MKRFALVTLITVFGLSCTVIQSQNEVLLKIDNKEITKGEFQYIFSKNNTDSVITSKDIKEYLEMCINFNLKVH